MGQLDKQFWLECVAEKLTPPSNPLHPDMPTIRSLLRKLNSRDLAALERVLDHRIKDAKEDER
jgi:hypothetical protein